MITEDKTVYKYNNETKKLDKHEFNDTPKLEPKNIRDYNAEEIHNHILKYKA